MCFLGVKILPAVCQFSTESRLHICNDEPSKSTAAYHELGLARVSKAQFNSALFYSISWLHGRRQHLCNALQSAAMLTFANALWTQSEISLLNCCGTARSASLQY